MGISDGVPLITISIEDQIEVERKRQAEYEERVAKGYVEVHAHEWLTEFELKVKQARWKMSMMTRHPEAKGSIFRIPTFPEFDSMKTAMAELDKFFAKPAPSFGVVDSPERLNRAGIIEE